MKTFSWSRYDSLRLDPEPGTSIWDYEIEEEPEPEYERCEMCSDETEDDLYFDDVPYCGYCFAMELTGGLEAA